MKNMKTVIIITVFLLSSCGEGSGDGDEINGSSFNLDGTWISNCYKTGNEYYIDKYIFSGDSFHGDINLFNNSSCNGAPVNTVEASSSFRLGKTITTSSGIRVLEMDMTMTIMGGTVDLAEIIKINGNQFNWGVESDPEKRPKEVNYEITYTRKNP